MIIRLLTIALIATLAYSVATSGIRYQYDADELTQLQQGYLLATGVKPYQDFYYIYTPIFPALLGFVLSHMGFTFGAVEFLRFSMVALFGIRILFTSAVVAELFGSFAAWAFPVLLLLDPFTTFSGMQIRYDNLMLTVYTIAVFLCITALKRKNITLLVIAGGLFSLSFLIMAKIVPSLAIFLFIVGFWCIARKKWKEFGALVVGGIIVAVLYSIPFMLDGTFFLMVQQAFLTPRAFHASTQYPTYVGFLYQPDNIFIYGLPGRPLTWIYAWGLPILGFAGAYFAVVSRLGRSPWRIADVVIVSMAGGLFAHWLLLFFLPLVFVQYYLPISTYYALFGAANITQAWHGMQGRRGLRIAFTIVLSVNAILLVRTSFQANMARAKIDTHWTVERYQKLWSIIPPDGAVFPEVLFRPIAYPLFAGYFTCCAKGDVLRAKYRPIQTYLAARNVRFLVLSDYVFGFLPAETKRYIGKNYTTNAAYPDVYVRTQ